jgi:hypothetical protein
MDSAVMSRAMSTAAPTAAELEENQRFHADLLSGVLLTTDGVALAVPPAQLDERRASVLTILQNLATIFVAREVQELRKSVYSADTADPWAEVRPFGSSALEANVVDSDMDAYVEHDGV